MVDVSVIHPAAVTYIDHAQRPLGAAAFREREKETKYATLIADEKAEFVPFVMESTGALGRQAKQFLEKLVISLNLTREFTAAWEIKDYLSRGLAIALQRGNAAVMPQGAEGEQCGGLKGEASVRCGGAATITGSPRGARWGINEHWMRIARGVG